MPNPENPDPEKPKIIVDDDWKSRVQQEKKSQTKSGAEDSPAADPQSGRRRARSEPDLPPATFETLVSMLVTQALASLGQIPLGDKQEPVVMLDHAKHSIDLLEMLEQKTTGNLSPVESKMLGGVLHELRMLFVAMQSQPPNSQFSP